MATLAPKQRDASMGTAFARRPIAAVVILVAALALRIGYQVAFDVTRDGVPLRISLAAFAPHALGEDWSEADVPLDEGVDRKAGVTDYVSRYYGRSSDSVWLYVGYYDGTSVQSIHQPEICYPGAGWELKSNEVSPFRLEGSVVVPCNLLRFEKGETTQLTAYTFYYEDRFEPDQGTVEKGRVFGDRHFAIVTVSTHVRKGVGESRELLRRALERLVPRLLEHLPAVNERE